MGIDSLTGILSSENFMQALLQAVPCGILVLDEDRRIRAVNNVMEQVLCVSEKSVLGKRGGEALGCVYAVTAAEGCGTANECDQCEARRIALAALHDGVNQRTRVVLKLSVSGILKEVDLHQIAKPFRYRGKRLVLIILEDTTRLAELRRKWDRKRLDEIVGEGPGIRQVIQSTHEVA